MTNNARGPAAAASERQLTPSSVLWDRVLNDGHASLVRARHAFRYLPSAPRCIHQA